MKETLADRIMAVLARGGVYTVVDLHRRVGTVRYKRSSVFSAALDLAEVGYVLTSTAPRNGNGGIRLYALNPKKTYVPSNMAGKHKAENLAQAFLGATLPQKVKARHVVPAPVIASDVIDQATSRKCQVVLYLVNGEHDVQPATSRHGKSALLGNRGTVVGVYDATARPEDVINDILVVR